VHEAHVVNLTQLRTIFPRVVLQKVRECGDRGFGLLNVREKFLANLLNKSGLLFDVLLEFLGSVDLDDISGSHIGVASVHFVRSCLLSDSVSN